MTADKWIDVLALLVAMLTGLVTSSGFWIYVEKKKESKDLANKLLMGLALDRIVHLGSTYIKRGNITHDEYDILCDHLYEPYVGMGGNSSAKRMMAEIAKLPFVQTEIVAKETTDAVPVKQQSV